MLFVSRSRQSAKSAAGAFWRISERDIDHQNPDFRCFRPNSPVLRIAQNRCVSWPIRSRRVADRSSTRVSAVNRSPSRISLSSFLPQFPSHFARDGLQRRRHIFRNTHNYTSADSIYRRVTPRRNRRLHFFPFRLQLLDGCVRRRQ